MNNMKFIKHFITITKHRHIVIKYCFKSGLYHQGLTHDLSKYSKAEFWPSVKYYNGFRSPIGIERRTIGYSYTWLHHKGRNKHHPEYWVDLSIDENQYLPIIMPDKYIGEMFCDHLAASKVYNKKNFKPQMVLDYYYKKESKFLPMHEVTKEKFELLLNIYIEQGEHATFKYIKKNFRKKKKNVKNH